MAVDTKPARERRGTTLSLRQQQDLGKIPPSSFASRTGPGGLFRRAASPRPSNRENNGPRQLCLALLGTGQPWISTSCSDAHGVTGCLQDSRLVRLNGEQSLPPDRALCDLDVV